jgi:hypothetical protein
MQEAKSGNGFNEFKRRLPDFKGESLTDSKDSICSRTDTKVHQVLRQRSVRLSRVLKLDLTALNELKSLLSGRMRSVNRMRR